MTLRVSGKQNPLFPLGSVIKCLITHAYTAIVIVAVKVCFIKGPLKYLLMPLLGKNQLAITLHMYASIAPNLDNTQRGANKVQFMTSSYYAQCHVTRNRKMHFT